MACALTLNGQLLVGGDGCGCSSGASGAPRKLQPLSLACGAQYDAIQSTDCAQRVNSPTAWVDLPVGALGSVELLYLFTSTAMEVRWGGSVPELTGSQIFASVIFAGGEVFTFSVEGTSVPVTFTAGTRTLAQIRDVLNAQAVAAGVQFMPVSLDASGTRLVIRGTTRAVAASVAVTAALAAIGFGATASDVGADPELHEVSGIYLHQWPRMRGAAPNFQIRGTGDFVLLVAGTAN